MNQAPNKKIKIILTVVLAAAVFAGWRYFYSKNKSENNSAPNSIASSANIDEPDKEDFSLTYPDGFKVSESSPAEGVKLVVAEDVSKRNTGLQIFTEPFDEAGTLTSERIKADLPDKIIKNSKTGRLSGVPILAFESESANFGKTFEVWFIYKGKLYQIMTYLSFAKDLQNILQSWKFK